MKNQIAIYLALLCTLSCSDQEVSSEENYSNKLQITNNVPKGEGKKSRSYSKRVTIAGDLRPDGTILGLYGLRLMQTPLMLDNENIKNDPNGSFKFIILSKGDKVIRSFKKDYIFNSTEHHFAISIDSAYNEFYLKVFIKNKLRFTSGLIKVKKCEMSSTKCIQSMRRRKVK